MPSAQSSSPRWPVGYRIRPVADPDSTDVEVADAITARRFRWSPEALSAYILDDGSADRELTGGDAWFHALASAGDRGHLIRGLRHWQERGWHPSDQYYVASRRWEFVDVTDVDGAIRTATIERFLSTDGPPVPERRPAGPRVPLGPAAEPGTQPVSQLLVSRRSGRAYVARPAPAARLSGMLWYGLAPARQRREETDPAQPLSYLESLGAAWDFYLCIYSVDGVPSGTYRYDLLSHELTTIRPGNHRDTMMDVLQGMRSPATAAWTLGLVADVPRYQWRYRHDHGLRRLYLEAGLLAQELLILGMSYGFSTLVTPAQKDSAYLALHDLPAERFAPVYTLTMGLSRGSAGMMFDDSAGAPPIPPESPTPLESDRA